ncbi:MAG: hypothetical protein OEV45_02610 [Desulfobacteraceae bacterium]|nr:hypothetical protein [Desulfobacteraceae bacterium]
MIAIFMVAAFVSTSLAGDLGARFSKDWTPEQIRAFAKKPRTAEEKAKMGSPDMGYILNKEGFSVEKHTGKNLTAKQMYENGKAVWTPVLISGIFPGWHRIRMQPIICSVKAALRRTEVSGVRWLPGA